MVKNKSIASLRHIQQGAHALIDLVETIGDISKDTCCLLADDQETDTRDYKTMAAVVSDTLQAMLAPQQDPRVREGFMRAMADLLCMTADGCGIGTDKWKPIEVTEFSFSGRLQSALNATAGKEVQHG